MAIDKTAVIDPKAEVDPSAIIGPFCAIGPNVKIGPETQLISHVAVQNHTTLGARNIIYPFTSVGGAPQDLKFKGEPSRLIIGDDNVFREGVTLNIGTEGGHMETRIGNRCLFMAYTHVAHDSTVGDGVVLANSAGLAGHVSVGDSVIIGGLAGVHQFCKVGRNAFLAAGAMVSQDVPPFCIAQGDRAQLVGINVIGLKRAGWDREKIQAIRDAFRRLFHSNGTRLLALDRTEAELAPLHPEVAEMCTFIREAERGVCSPRIAHPYEG